MNSCPSGQRHKRSSSVGRRTAIPCLKSDHSAKSNPKNRRQLLVRSKSCLSTPLASTEFRTPRLRSEFKSSQYSRNCMTLQCGRQSRPQSKFETPVSCSSSKYETARLRSMVSPHRLKQQYTSLNEKKHLPRITHFVESHRLPFNVLKPVTMNVFIGVTQLFVARLCSPSQPPLTSKNYKTEIPKVMKDLQYPITINQSFLKSSNTPQQFTNVLSMWTFLMDLVDLLEEPVEFRGMADNILKYANTESKEEAKEELVWDQLDSAGYTAATLISRCQELENESEIMKGQLVKKEFEVQTIVAEIACKQEQHRLVKFECEQIINTHNSIEKELNSIEKQFDYSHTILLESQKKLSATEEKLNAIRNKNDSFSFSLDDVQHVTIEMEIHAQRLQKLKACNDLFGEQLSEKQNQEKEIYMKADGLMIDYNTALTMSKLPEDEKWGLKFNEDEMQLAQVKKVSDKVLVMMAMMQKGEKINQDLHALLDKKTDMLLTYERQLEEAMVEAEERKKQKNETDMGITEEIAQINAINEKSEQVVEKIINFTEALPMALKKRTTIKEALEKHNKETKASLTKIKFIADKTNGLIKEKAAEFEKIREECNAKKLANAIEFKTKLDALTKDSSSN